MNKVALITGSKTGIGKGIALRLAKDGYDIAINDLKEDGLDEVKKEIEALGVRCEYYVADVSNEEQVNEMFDKLIKDYSRLDVLVNNAGICPIRTMDKVSKENMMRTFDINVVSMMLCANKASMIMIKQGKGKIINAASQSSFRETPITFEYTTTKWAIRGMTRAMAASLAKYNITVNAYCPGTVITPMQEAIAENTAKLMNVSVDDVRKVQTNSVPLGRLQTVEDIAGLVSFLASDDSDNITGQNILVNGGQVMN